MTINLRQQIVLDRVKQVAGQLEIDNDHAFLRFVHQIVTGQSIFSFDIADLIEGGQDKQIDTITIDEEPTQATVYIIQAKNTEGFSSNAIIQMKNGLEWLFNKPRVDVNKLQNKPFKDKIMEYRSLQNSLGPSNIRVIVRFATWGLTGNLSAEFQQELKTIQDKYDIGTFAEFSCEPLGADEIVYLLNIHEKRERKIDADIRIKYDANNPSLIRYFSEDLKGLVCSVPASEIACIVNEDKEGAIFDLNIRRFLGGRGAVNKDIQETCTNADQSYLFWFLNNGITIVCDELDAVTDPDNPHIKVKNMQIVNGCQTATTLALAQKEGYLAKDVRVIARIYETNDRDLVNRVVLTTNNQNRISNRDLRANDQVQIDLENGFEIHNFFYERKIRQYIDTDIDSSRVIPNESVAQAYLAIVLRKPSDARGRKYKVWGELYDRIFSGFAVEPYIISALIVKHSAKWLASTGLTTTDDDIRRNISKKGTFHVARIATYLWRKGDQWDIDQDNLRRQLQIIEKSPEDIDVHLKKGFKILEKIIREDAHYEDDIDSALKSYTLDEKIDRTIYSN